GIAIYYSFIGKGKTAAFARDIRQQLTAATQRVFKLRDFRGVNLRYLTLLDRAGIRNVKDILESGSTASERRELAQKTGVPEDAILEFVKLADLSRLDGVKGIRARLYYSAGVDTVEKLSSWDPDELLAMLRDFVTNTGFKGIAPLPKEVHETIARAKELPRIVQYD
ncbi:MAG TPA: hypothetical protein DCE14_07175, partial [Kosmotogaceae bacterium]|nr:hypothetical protein [Kosmotogaceae bacterium]